MRIPIKFIYFDIGNVLFDVDHTAAWQDTLNATNLDKMTAQERFYKWGAPIEHMTGNLSDAQFFSQMKILLEYMGSSATLKFIWTSVFKPNPLRIHQALELIKTTPAGLLSNISPCHSESIEIRNASIEKFYPRIYSWSCGYMKPRHEIFKEAIESCNFKPEEILFIDDQQQHCEAARSFGMNALQIIPEDSIISSIESSGFQLKNR